MIYLFSFLLLHNIDPKDKRIKELEEKINELEIQLKNEKDKYKKLESLFTTEKNKLDILAKQLNDEKNKNSNLSKEYNKFKEKIKELKLEIPRKNNQGSLNTNNSNEIIQLYKKIENLNDTIKRYPVILEENEKLISIIFESSDQKMHYSMICKNTDTISDLEKKLYNEYPDFVLSDNIFLCKGTVINRYKSFESYKIKNGDIIILNKRND